MMSNSIGLKVKNKEKIKNGFIIKSIFVYTVLTSNKSFFISMGLDEILYIVSIMFMFMIFITMLKKKSIFVTRFLPELFFISYVFIRSVFLLEYGYEVSLLAFSSIAFYLILWTLFFITFNHNRKKKFFDDYINLHKKLVLFVAFLGVYQYYIDSTLFGFATHYIYSNPELVNNADIVKRSTALFGSPQNYGFYIGIGIILWLFDDDLLRFNVKNIIIIFILLLGAFVGGSRITTVAILLTFVIKFLKSLSANSNKVKNVLFVIILPLFVIIIYSFNSKYRTFNRLFDFIGNLPVLNIMYNHLKFFNVIELIFGRGLDYNNRILHLAFDFSYIPIESYLLEVLLRLGLVGFLPILYILIKGCYHSLKYKNYRDLTLMLFIVVDLIFTPSFSGNTMSYILWPIILYNSTMRGGRVQKPLNKKNY